MDLKRRQEDRKIGRMIAEIEPFFKARRNSNSHPLRLVPSRVLEEGAEHLTSGLYEGKPTVQ